MRRALLSSRRSLLALAGVGSGGAGAYYYYQKHYKEEQTTPLRYVIRNTLQHQLYAEEDKLKDVQSTVYTGNHAQCAIAVIHIKHDLQSRNKVLKQVNQLEQIVNRVRGEDVPPDTDEDELPVVMAGVGFDTRLWRSIAQENNIQLPKIYGDYKRRSGEYGTMPDTNGDIVLHVKASTRSQCYEVVQAFVDALGDSVDDVEDRYGWQYRDGRDLSGFIDGTMNPADPDERIEASIIPQTHGSFLLHQVWRHDLNTLKKIGISEQEGFVGRSKDWSVELAENEMPLTSHVKRMRDASGNRIPIVRQSMPYGSVGGDSGLLFIAYSSDVKKLDDLLDSMVGKASHHQGHNDAIMKFSKNIRGNYYYIPSKTELKKFQ